MKDRKTISATGIGPLTEFDWNFDGVSNNELVACCYWEYARESVFIRDSMRVLHDAEQRQGRFSEAFKNKLPDLDKFFAMGIIANLITNRAFPDPWQSLDAGQRSSTVRFLLGKNKHFLSKTPKAVHFPAFQAADEALLWNTDLSILGSLYRRARRMVADFEAKKSIRPRPGFPGCEEHPIKNRHTTNYDVLESFLVHINWRDYSNKEVVECFRRWVKAVRPKDFPDPSGRGHRLKEWRANLARLSVMRLLSHYTPKQILGGLAGMAIRECRPIRESKQFASDKWVEATKWHDARREAGRLFHTLFPFLPPGEKPLSWIRTPPGK